MSGLPVRFLALLGMCSLAAAQSLNSPSIRIQDPGGTVIQTQNASVVLKGTAGGRSAIVNVHWVDQFGERGNATFTPLGRSGAAAVEWVTEPIRVRPGVNQITLIAVDENNGSSTAHLVLMGTRGIVSPEADPEIHTGYWRGNLVTYRVVNGIALAGDMVLDHIQDHLNASIDGSGGKLTKRSYSVDYTSQLWPKVNGVAKVPYTVIPGSSSSAVSAAVTAFNSSLTGVIQYVAQSTETNYVSFDLSASDTSGTCQSSVGMVGGQQFITGSGSCQVSTLVHEMGHSIGLFHEHQRLDNASYITLNLTNIDKPLIQGNFDRITSDDQDIGLYDYVSVMHYNPFAFSKNGNPTIESIPAGIPMSNTTGYSLGDVDGIKRLYGFTPSQVTITTNPSGLKITVDGSTVTAPQTFSWALGSTHTLSIPSDPQTTSPADGSTYEFGNWNDLGTRSHTITLTPGSGLLTSSSAYPAVTLYEASFIRLQPFASSVFPTGSGSVALSPAPQSIFNGSFYVDRQKISLTATPTGSYNFAGWFGLPYPQSANPRNFYVQQPVSNAQASFVTAPVTKVAATVSGSTPVDFLGMAATVDGTFYYLPQAFANDLNFGGSAWAAGTSHTLAVTTPQSPITTNIRYTFNTWADNVTTASRSITAPSSGVVTYSAGFNSVYRTYGTPAPNCGGTVGFSPASPTNDGFYQNGTLLSLTATPSSGLLFAGWSGDLSGTSNPASATITDQFIPVASFNAIATPISITSFSPTSVSANASAQDLTVNGTGFTASTQAFWNLSYRSSTYVSANQIIVHLQAGDLSTPGGNRVSVQNVVNGCYVFVEGTLDVTTAPPAAPTADSVSPASGSGNSQTFTFKYSSANGYAYLSRIYGLMNSSLSGSGGCFFQYYKPSNTLYLYGDDGSSVAGTLTPGQSGTINNSQCTLSGSSFTASGSANQLTLVVPMTFKSTFAAAKTIYGYASDQGNSASGWQTLGTWTPNTPVNTPPTADSVSPASGNGPSQTFTFKYSSVNGYGYLGRVFGVLNSSLTAANACFFQYYSPSNTLYLYNNDGSTIAGTLTPGQSGTINNTQCTLSGSAFTASGVGTQLTLAIPVTFTAAFAGPKTWYGYASDQGNLNSGWQTLGTWITNTITNNPPTADSVSPASGTGTPQTFTFKYSSVNGYAYLGRLFGVLNTTLNGSGGCFFQFYEPTNTLYLYSDNGSSVAGTLTPGQAGTVNNSQCTLSGSAFAASGSGNQLTLTIPASFSASFAGPKTWYSYASDQGNLNSGWQTLGTWTPITPANTAPTADSVSPNSGSGATQTFTFKYSSVNGYGYLGRLFGLVNSTLSGSAGCFFQYYEPASTLYLYANDGSTVAGTLTPGQAGTINNSQCTISGPAFTATGSGSQLTLAIPVTFSGTFTGAKTVYGNASDQGNLSSGWITLGTWTH